MSHVATDTQRHLREATDWRHAFIASFPGQSNDETPEAMEAARYAGVTPHVLSFQNQDPLGKIDQILGDLDDVYISLTTAPWQIYSQLRESHTLVSLDGHGADELMGGYMQAGQPISFMLRNHAARLSQRSNAIRHAIDSAKLAALSARRLNFLRGHLVLAPQGPDLPSDSDTLPSNWGPLNRRLYRMFHGTVLPTILRNFDRLSMVHGVEVRMPFMDWRLVTYVMSLPDDAKSQDGRTKAVARNALTGHMPESIRTAKRKVGFNSPMPEWLNGALGVWASRLLHHPEAQFDALVDRRALLRRVDSLNKSRGWDWESCGRLWPYLNFKWYLDAQKVCK
jgi:asparagine synthase (glutamine-hydrolysing)